MSEEEKAPRLVRWKRDGYPPIDLHNELKAVLELINAYEEMASFKAALIERVEQETPKDWADPEDYCFSRSQILTLIRECSPKI